VATDLCQAPLAQLQRSRAELLELARQLRGHSPQQPSAFPRSAILRTVTSRRARAVWGVAAVALVVLRPRLLLTVGRLLPLAVPVVSGVLKRYLLRRFLS